MATFHEEDTKLWTKNTQTRVRTPVKDPRRAWSRHGFQATTPPTSHARWGNAQFKYLGRPSYRAYWFHMLAYDQLVQRLIKVKHTMVPYSFFGSKDSQNSSFALYSTTTIPSSTIVWLYQVNLQVISGPLVAFSVDFFYTLWFDLSSWEGGKDVLKSRMLNMHQLSFKQLLDLNSSNAVHK